MKSKSLFFTLIALALLVSACQPATTTIVESVVTDNLAAGQEVFADVDGAELERAVSADLGLAANEPALTGYEQSVAMPAGDDRIIIKNANLTLEVEHPAAQVDSIMRLAEELGGFVVSSNVYAQASNNGYDVPRAEITIRVPAAKFNQVIASLEGGANKVVVKNVTGQDVTQQYTDLQSRLRNLEDAAEQLQRIMDDAYQTSDVLSVYNELVRVNEQAEVIRGQIKYYAEAASFSAIVIQLQAPYPVVEVPAPKPAWQRALENSLEALGEMVELTVGLAIWLGVFLLPTLLMYVTPIVLLWQLIKWLRNRNKTAAPAPAGD